MEDKGYAHHIELADYETQRNNTVAALDGYIPDSQEEHKLVRKIDLYLLPTIWLMYLLSYMDRTNSGEQHWQCQNRRYG
ncbi:hypothetical protein KCU68_g19831, partial [Aureobasidium melanogenum]